MADNTVTFQYQGTTVQLPIGTSDADARAILSRSMPDITNATFVSDGRGGGSFVPRTGTKG